MHITHHIFGENFTAILTFVNYVIVAVAAILVLELGATLHDKLLHTVYGLIDDNEVTLSD